jgi:hypothetical protein
MNCPLADMKRQELSIDIGEEVLRVVWGERRAVSCCLMMAPRVVLPLIAENNNPTRDLHLAHHHWSGLY